MDNNNSNYRSFDPSSIQLNTMDDQPTNQVSIPPIQSQIHLLFRSNSNDVATPNFLLWVCELEAIF